VRLFTPPSLPSKKTPPPPPPPPPSQPLKPTNPQPPNTKPQPPNTTGQLVSNLQSAGGDAWKVFQEAMEAEGTMQVYTHTYIYVYYINKHIYIYYTYKHILTHMNQSINQSTNQPINQSINHDNIDVTTNNHHNSQWAQAWPKSRTCGRTSSTSFWTCGRSGEFCFSGGNGALSVLATHTHSHAT
jgi:hypothetical protein